MGGDALALCPRPPLGMIGSLQLGKRLQTQLDDGDDAAIVPRRMRAGELLHLVPRFPQPCPLPLRPEGGGEAAKLREIDRGAADPERAGGAELLAVAEVGPNRLRRHIHGKRFRAAEGEMGGQVFDPPLDSVAGPSLDEEATVEAFRVYSSICWARSRQSAGQRASVRSISDASLSWGDRGDFLPSSLPA